MFGLFGLAALLALAWCLSAERWHIPYRVVLGGVALQVALAIFLHQLPPADRLLFHARRWGWRRCRRQPTPAPGSSSATLAGPRCPSRRSSRAPSFILAFKAFPLVLVISALAVAAALLGHLAAHRGGLRLRVAPHPGRSAARWAWARPCISSWAWSRRRWPSGRIVENAARRAFCAYELRDGRGSPEPSS